MQFSSTLSELRENKKMSREKLAKKAGISEEVLAAWESGKEYPDQEHLLLLARSLKVSIARLVDPDRELMLR